jgi:hypothetical protein
MTTPTPHTIGATLEQLVEMAVFSDPATAKLRAEWEQTKRTEQEVFDRVYREEYERRLDYHRICQTPDPEGTARHETNLCKILFREELDDRLAERWATIQRRVRAVLEDKHGEQGDTPRGQGSGEGNGAGT